MKVGFAYIIFISLVFKVNNFKFNSCMQSEEVIINWIDLIEKIPESSFKLVDNFEKVPNPPRAESKFWSQNFFKADMNPHSRMGVQHSYVCNKNDIDLLRHQYVIHDSDTVTIFEGINFFIIRFSLVHHDLGNKNVLIQKKAEEILNVNGQDYNWYFNSTVHIGNETIFTTNKNIAVSFLKDWKSRADALIRNNHLYIVTYKKLPSVTGFLNPYQWFLNEDRH